MSAIDDVLASVKSSGANVTADVHGNRIVLRGVTGLEITCESGSAFRVQEDLGNVSGGVQTQVQQPARWGSIGGPPDSYEEMMSKLRRWLADQLRLGRRAS